MNAVCWGLAAVALLSGQSSGRDGPRAEVWVNTQGVKVDPLHPPKGKTGVLVFMMTDCPIANSYAPELHRIVSKYSAKGILFGVVYVDSELPAEAIQRHAEEFPVGCTVIADPSRTLAYRAGAKVSPEAVVIGPKGDIVYRGRIDDRATGYGKILPQPRRHDLRLTLDAILAGKPVPRASTPCVGCFISAPSSK